MERSKERRPVPQLKQFLASSSDSVIRSSAERAGTTRAYLAQLAGGHRVASAELAKALEQEIPGLLRAHLRPDLYGDLQPIDRAETA